MDRELEEALAQLRGARSRLDELPANVPDSMQDAAHAEVVAAELRVQAVLAMARAAASREGEPADGWSLPHGRRGLVAARPRGDTRRFPLFGDRGAVQRRAAWRT